MNHLKKLKPLWIKFAPRYKKLLAGQFLQLEIKKLVQTLHLEQDGPYDIGATMPLLCDYFLLKYISLKALKKK